MDGAQIIEGCRVTCVDIRDGRVAGVQTELGDIECEIAVNCCGIWAREGGRLANVSVPVQPSLRYTPDDGDARTALLDLVLPGSFGGTLPEAMPWDE